MSGARRRRKGDRLEREIVARHKALGFHGERNPLSGASRFSGSAHDIDLLLHRAARPAAPNSSAGAPARLVVVLKPRGCGRFDVFFNGSRIITNSVQTISNTARVLHRLGYTDDDLLVARHDGADHDAIRGPLGVWRKVRVREDQRGLRYVRWEPLHLRRVRAQKREIVVEGAGDSPHGIRAKNAVPGAASVVRLMSATAAPARPARSRTRTKLFSN